MRGSFATQIGRCAALATVVVAGCAPDAVKPTSRPATGPAVGPPPVVTMVSAGGDGAAMAIHLDVYVMDLTAGQISGNEAFWRSIDEDAAGAAAGQLMLANGMRVGVAPRNRWREFAQAFGDDLNHAKRSNIDGWSTQSADLGVGEAIERENLFFLNGEHQLEGRTYVNAKNGLALRFSPTPRDPSSVRLTLCPTVRRDHTRMDYSALNSVMEQPGSDVDRIYDLGITVDVPPDGFLVIAPDSLAMEDPDHTLGGRFLLRRDAASRREYVVVVSPRLIPLNAVK